MNILRKLSIVATAALGLGFGSAQAITQAELAEIRLLIEAGDIPALLAYLDANPQVLDDTPLGLALQEIANNPVDVLDTVAQVPPEVAEVTNLVEQAKTDATLY